MRFFSRLTVIFNICFIVAVTLRLVENAGKKNMAFTGLVKTNPVESTFVISGYGAIQINILFNFILLIFLIIKRRLPDIPAWIIWFNFIFLLFEFGYFINYSTIYQLK